LTSSVSSSSRQGDAITSARVRSLELLVRHGEEADLLDRVAEEVDPDRVLLGRREHVDDAAADRELASAFDEVDAVVGRAHERVGQLVEVEVLADHEPDGLELTQALDLRLQDAADRGHDDPRGHLALGVAAEPAEDGEPTADRVGPGAQPLVRERLPGRVVGDGVLAHKGLQRRGDVLGFAVGGGHDQYGPAGTAPLGGGGQGGGDQRPHRWRCGDVQSRQGARTCVTDGFGDGGFGKKEVNESR
jgi:hypothetical protein